MKNSTAFLKISFFRKYPLLLRFVIETNVKKDVEQPYYMDKSFFYKHSIDVEEYEFIKKNFLMNFKLHYVPLLYVPPVWTYVKSKFIKVFLFPILTYCSCQ